MKMIPCIRCKNDMPELRKIQYGYNFCVKCSTVGIKKAISIQKGNGDHTWNETLIVDENHYNEYLREKDKILKFK